MASSPRQYVQSMHATSQCCLPMLLKVALPAAELLHLVRHGQTEMNVYLGHSPYGSPDFKDPLMCAIAPACINTLRANCLVPSSSVTTVHGLQACSYDTALTRTGVEQAKAAAKHSKHLRPPPELIIASPLSRALHTADLCLPQSTYPNVPRVAHPLARERLYLSSDVGLSK